MSQDSQVFQAAYNRCRNFLIAGKSVVFDACNITVGARRRVLACAQGLYNVEKIGYVMAADVWKCIERDSKRDRVCGQGVILSYAESYVFPKMMEGFTEIRRERPNFR